MRKIIWWIKQLFPLTYFSKYKENNKNIICIWKMFAGKCYNIQKYNITEK
jgi:hypothetical protein